MNRILCLEGSNCGFNGNCLNRPVSTHMPDLRNYLCVLPQLAHGPGHEGLFAAQDLPGSVALCPYMGPLVDTSVDMGLRTRRYGDQFDMHTGLVKMWMVEPRPHSPVDTDWEPRTGSTRGVGGTVAGMRTRRERQSDLVGRGAPADRGNHGGWTTTDQESDAVGKGAWACDGEACLAGIANHACEPACNCVMRHVWFVCDKRLWPLNMLYTLERPVMKGTELTYKYGYPNPPAGWKCRCEACNTGKSRWSLREQKKVP
jgi:hypothetical protein